MVVEHLSVKVEQRLQWRRDKIREYSIKGYTQRDIAAELQVPLTDVNRDLKYLRLKAPYKAILTRDRSFFEAVGEQQPDAVRALEQGLARTW